MWWKSNFKFYLLTLKFDFKSVVDLLRALSDVGEVVWFENNLELHDRIFLRPEVISNTIEDILDLPSIKLTLEQRVALLQSLK